MAKSQVTTGVGDAGTTITIAGRRLPKNHPIVECSGSVDEARAQAALCRRLLADSGDDRLTPWGEELWWIIHVLFLAGSECSDPEAAKPQYRAGQVGPEHLKRLEILQAQLEAATPLPPKFIACASTVVAAELDIFCTSVRRLERNIAGLKETVPEFENAHLLAFVNRLSDFAFMLARFAEDGKHHIVDYGCLEEPASGGGEPGS